MAEKWTSRRMAALVAAAFALGLVLAACGGGTGSETAHRGSVDQATRQQVISALTSAGVEPTAQTELRLTWKQDEPDTVLAEGSFKKSGQPGAAADVYEVRKEANGTWTVRPAQ